MCHGDVVVCARCAAAAQVDRQLIYGTGTNGQVLCVDFTPGITTIAASMHAYVGIPDILECLAAVAGDDDDHREAARLFGAAQAIRQRMGEVRFNLGRQPSGLGDGTTRCDGPG